MANPVVELENVRREYLVGDQVTVALAGVDLVIERGEFVAIVGPSGSGKSTLLNLLGLLDTPTQGQIWLDQQPVPTDPAALAQLREARRMGDVWLRDRRCSARSSRERHDLMASLQECGKHVTPDEARPACEKDSRHFYPLLLLAQTL